MVSIIILSYNTKSLLRECLQAIFASLHSVSFEVIVFDNASKDESPEMVRKEFPSIQIIKSDTNLGFAKGINTASKKATGQYLLFLNSDATLLDEYLAEMVTKLEQDKDASVIGGNLLSEDDTTSAAFGSFYDLKEIVRLLFFAKKTRPKLKDTFSQVDWVSGGYMLIKSAVFEKVGGFDEFFFMYIEDMDLCYRLRKLGYGVYYFQKAKAKHIGQGSSNRSFAIVNIYKGLLYFYKKHKSYEEYFIVQLLLVTKAVSALIVGFITGNAYLRQTYSQALKVIV